MINRRSFAEWEEGESPPKPRQAPSEGGFLSPSPQTPHPLSISFPHSFRPDVAGGLPCPHRSRICEAGESLMDAFGASVSGGGSVTRATNTPGVPTGLEPALAPANQRA
jgi:hypothetical protein